MLTPEEIAALGDAAEQVARPITEFLIKDVARRVSGAAQLTSTAAYQIYRAQQLGLSREEIKKRLELELGLARKEVERLLTQSAEVGYRFDLSRFPEAAVPFSENTSVQQMVKAAVELAQENLLNITETMGMVAPNGQLYLFQDGFQRTMDFAFQQVFTGGTDYVSAVRRACRHLADQGIRSIEYTSGRHISLEVAVRRNILGGAGLMQEKISKYNYETLGANGWEISAHAGSAPDHEPIQGKQYPDKKYAALNSSLTRRIGTLNCGHAAFPIILGVHSPQYSEKQLEDFKEKNKVGISYQGKQYSLYETSQQQRRIERAIRKQKNRILVDGETGDSDKLLVDQIKLKQLSAEYQRFSDGAGLRTKNARLEVAGFGRKQAGEVHAAHINKKAVQTGGKHDIGDIEWWVRRETESIQFYEQIRSDCSDIEKISKHTGFATEDIEQIKDHIFFKKHILRDGQYKTFDPDYDMSVAWARLRSGKFEERDILLLQHELLENQIEKAYNVSAQEAHEKASEQYDWNARLKREKGDYGEDDCLDAFFRKDG